MRIRSFQRRSMAVRPWPESAALRLGTVVKPRSISSVPTAPKRPGVYLAILFILWYAVTSAGAITSRDGQLMYDTASALLTNGTIALPTGHHATPYNGHFFSNAI